MWKELNKSFSQPLGEAAAFGSRRSQDTLSFKIQNGASECLDFPQPKAKDAPLGFMHCQKQAGTKARFSTQVHYHSNKTIHRAREAAEGRKAFGNHC